MLEVEFPNHMIVELWLCQFCQWLHVVRAQGSKGSKGVGGYEMPHGYYPLVLKHRYGKFFIFFDDYMDNGDFTVRKLSNDQRVYPLVI